MQVIFLIAIFVSLLTVVFAVQNAAPVLINFLVWRFEGSLALILVVAFCCGALASSLFAIPFRLKRHQLLAEKERRIKELEGTLLEDKTPNDPPDTLQE